MKYKINLLPPKQESLLDKVVFFALHYLRYILVITQIVVIGVFFYRFKIDQEIIDLKEELEQKQEIVTVSESLMKEAGIIDLRLREVGQVLSIQKESQGSLSYFSQIFPQSLYVNKLSMTGGDILFDGIGASINAIKLFYQKIVKEGRYRTITLGYIKRTNEGFAFAFQLKGFADRTK